LESRYDSVVETVSFAIPQELPLTMTEATLFLPGLSPVGGKEITATFDGGQLSSDGGVLILREIEKRLGIAAILSACVPDARDPSRVIHSHADMIRAPLLIGLATAVAGPVIAHTLA